MGLGPPVCERCHVIGKLNQTTYRWCCPICGNPNMQWHAWSCGIDEEELESNYLFLKFMKGPNAVDKDS